MPRILLIDPLPPPLLEVCAQCFLLVSVYWLLGTSFQEKTDLASPITILPGHGTRLRDKGNLFFSLSERGKLHQARTTDTFWQRALRKTIWMPRERSSFEGIWTNDNDTLAQLDPLMHGRLRWILFQPVLATCGIRRPELACENPSCCLLLLADSSEEMYNLKH